MCHDYAHCPNQDCPKAARCFRAALTKEDIRLKKEEPETKLWCTYAGFKPNADGTCDNFIEMGVGYES